LNRTGKAEGERLNAARERARADDQRARAAAEGR